MPEEVNVFSVLQTRLTGFYHQLCLFFMTGVESRQERAKLRRKIFSNIMRQGRWGDEFLSGWGSSPDVTAGTREIILKVINEYEIRSMLDLPCGDVAWMSFLFERFPVGFRYTGADIVPALVERNQAKFPSVVFQQTDFVSDPLPKADLIFCRDALQHLPIPDIKEALENFDKSGARFLLTTTHLRRFGLRNHQHCRIGSCRDRNLMLPPFNLPDPLVIYSEQSEHKFLGLWKLPFGS